MSLFYLVVLARVGINERSIRQASLWWAAGTALFYTGTLLAVLVGAFVAVVPAIAGGEVEATGRA